jgi:hypothetical protein
MDNLEENYGISGVHIDGFVREFMRWSDYKKVWSFEYEHYFDD